MISDDDTKLNEMEKGEFSEPGLAAAQDSKQSCKGDKRTKDKQVGSVNGDQDC